MKKNSIVSKLVLGYLLLSGLFLAHMLWRDHAGQAVKASAVEPRATNLSFITRKDFLVGTDPRSAAQGDFNGDGIADLAVTHSNSQNLFIMIGIGDGTCGFSADPLRWPADAIQVGDFNDDKNLDLALGTFGQNGAVTIVLGNGTGSFRLSTRYDVPRLSSFGIGDFNNDSVPDLVVAWPGILSIYTGCVAPAGLDVRLGNGDGHFDDIVSHQVPPCSIGLSRMVLNDFDGDGNLDVLVPGRMWMGDGSGSFSTDRVVSTGAIALAVDLDGDGLLDLVGPGSYAARIWFGNARADFDAYHVAFGMEETPGAIAAGDLNGDGLVDLVAANPQGNKVTIFINDTK